jgi:hypothetical protein
VQNLKFGNVIEILLNDRTEMKAIIGLNRRRNMRLAHKAGIILGVSGELNTN